MLSLISFILVTVGCLNWFSIGILQYDFVAGIFGSQSNIFSRIIYTLVGIASLIVAFNLVKNKGKFIISFKKKNEEEFERYHDKKLATAKAESSKDNHITTKTHNKYENPQAKNNDDK